MITLEIDSGSGPRRVDLAAYLDPAAEERAHEDAYAWIKAVRHLRVDGVPFRSRFTFRGDSLWWFAELYLHKEQAILKAMRTIAAFDALVERERPRGGAVPCRTQSRRHRGGRRGAQGAVQRTRLARLRMAAGAPRDPGGGAGRRRPALASGPHPPPPERARVAAFVHRAFWQGGDGSAESYIGPVLRALEARVDRAEIRYVGIGARTNFRARRWWDPLRRPFAAQPGASDTGMVPIERYAPASALAASRKVYRDRASIRGRACGTATSCGRMPSFAAATAGRSCRRSSRAIALLQFPWSARSMDEAAAALDAIEPEVAVTYAEAGGWGRALALECRRRGIPLAGLQHGFIYRHWLNYRHEPDEMSRRSAQRRGCRASPSRPRRCCSTNTRRAISRPRAGSRQARWRSPAARVSTS